jgi:Domain of unknown function (DUF5618)
MKNNIVEAKRYIANAKQILSEKANKEDGFYQDKKYIRMAGNTAYNGVLEALDTIITEKKKGRKSVEWYKEHLAKMDRKALNHFISVYNILHLSLGYDGEPDARVAKAGIENAEFIISWAETKTA